MQRQCVNKRIFLWIGQMGWLVLLLGCTAPAVISSEPIPTTNTAALPTMAKADIGNHYNIDPDPRDGSLWVERGSLSEMFMNLKARQIGDIVTIRIVESSKATNNATTKTGRTTTMSAGLDNFFNLEQKYPSTKKFFNPFSPVAGSFDSEFDGSGTTARSGALTALITARIIQILPNGNFVIEGNREVRVNNENQIITLTGIVRPRDISADNVVQSTYIADARIGYSGSGILNDRQKPGWLMRILDNIWPF